MNRSTIAAALLLLSGCSAYDLKSSVDSGYYFEDDATNGTDDPFREPIRVDVRPISAPSPNGRDLLPQSFWLEATEDWTGLDLRLQPTIFVRGTVTGFAANPYGAQGPSVPGSDDAPVAAQVELYQPDTIAAAVTQTDEDGSFEVQVPAGEGYRLVVRPLDASSLPLTIVEDLSFTTSVQSLNLSLIEQGDSLSLEYGDPVYGRITDADGDPVSCTVRLIDSETGEETASVTTSATGYYALRAWPGDYTLQVIGNDSRAIPTVRRQISFEEGIGGGQFDVNLGEIEPVLLSGRIISAGGSPLPDATVRLTSTSLLGAEGSLVTETDSDSDGDFLVRALPGEWDIEIIPSNESLSESSPYSYAQEVGSSDLDLGDIALPSKVVFGRQVLDVTGQTAGGVVITFYQQGFNGATVNAQTDASGNFSVSLPDVPMLAYLTPTGQTRSAITRREVLNPSEEPSLDWVLADGAQVEGEVTVEGVSSTDGTYVVEVHSGDGSLYGSLVTTYDEAAEQAGFDLRIDLTEAR